LIICYRYILIQLHKAIWWWKQWRLCQMKWRWWKMDYTQARVGRKWSGEKLNTIPTSISGLPRPASDYARYQKKIDPKNPRWKYDNVTQFRLEMPDRTTWRSYGDHSGELSEQIKGIINIWILIMRVAVDAYRSHMEEKWKKLLGSHISGHHL